MFIDIHAHAYRLKPAFMPNFCQPTELLKKYDELGIEKGVLLPIVNPEVYEPQANEDIIEMAEMYPDRFIPFCNIDPRIVSNDPKSPIDYLLERYKNRGCRGIGEVMPKMDFLDPMLQNLFESAERVGLPVTFDAQPSKTQGFGLYDDPGLPGLETTLMRFPNLIIFGHGPMFWSEIGKLDTLGARGFVQYIKDDKVFTAGYVPTGPIKEEGTVPKLFRRYPNLLGDLSDFTAANAISRDPDYASAFLTEFQDRLFFGTDIISPKMEVPQVDILLDYRKKGVISEEVFQKIARENAIKFFGLE